MCGIAGAFGTASRDVIERMLAVIKHRGPDDAHLIVGEDFIIGARRLSIVDLEQGRQPMVNESGEIIAAQNGEIYNAPELFQNLAKKGHRFHSHCDTEVLPHLYEEEGLGFIEKLDGMFAVALWDKRMRRGILARDRMGKKPLYYTTVEGVFYFASEIKCLLEIPGFQKRIHSEALHHYLSLKHVPHPLSLFQGIHCLPPASRVIVEKGKPPLIEKYWHLSYTPLDLKHFNEEEAVDQLLDLLRKGIQRRLMADVPLGFFLSGGIDSSLTTALAAEISGQRIQTFTLTYANEASTSGKEQDKKWARWIAQKYNTEHFEETIHFSDFPENLRRILRCFDEPFSGVISTYFLAELISKHVKVAISGDGADELFGSYLPHRLALPLAQYDRYLATGDDTLIPGYASKPEELAKLAKDPDWKWRAKLLVFEEAEKNKLYTQDYRNQRGQANTENEVQRWFTSLTAQDPINRVLEAEFQSIFPDQVLTFVDRLSMAHSLEIRSPFLDTAFVNYCASLPGTLKMKGGVPKYLLKKAASRLFPQEMIWRPKEGFLMPITQWILQDLQDYVRSVLSPSRLRRHGIFDPVAVDSLLNRLYQNNNATYREVNRVYALLVFQEWYDLYMT